MTHDEESALLLLDPVDGFPLDCWVCEEHPAITRHEGHPICGECLDHFLEGVNRL